MFFPSFKSRLTGNRRPISIGEPFWVLFGLKKVPRTPSSKTTMKLISNSGVKNIPGDCEKNISQLTFYR